MHIARQHPRFGRLLAALAGSQLGDWLYNLALLAYVQERTHSTLWLGVTTAARIGPLVLAGPLGGLVADRFDRRRLMITADITRAALMLGLVAVAVTHLPVVLVPLLAAAATLAATPYPPCVAVVTPRLVPDDELPAANALRGAIAPACVAAGPVLGAVLLLVGPPPVAFAANAATFVISALLVASIPAGPHFAAPAEAATDTLASIAAELKAGARALIAVPEAGWMVGADTAASFAYGAQTVLLLLVAHRLGLHAAGYGYLLAALGAGGIVGATVAGRLGARAGRRSTLAVALVMVALPLPLLALTTSLAVAIGLGLVAGAGALVVEVVADTRLQRQLDERRLGCAYGFAFAVSVGGIAAGALLAPLFVALTGVGEALCLVSAVVLTLAVAIATRARRPRRAAAPAPATLA